MIPLIEAHRGDSRKAPENTLSAFARALRLGVPWIELDVRPAGDGTLMVIHDDNLERTTDGSGKVSDFSAEQLSRIDAGKKFSRTFTGEKIPRLTEVMEMISPTTTRINIEVKPLAKDMDVARRLVNILRRFGKQCDYVVSSSELDCLLEVRAIAPEITLAPIGNLPEILPLAIEHHFPWIHAHVSSATRENISSAHAKDIKVNVWTVDEVKSWPFWKAAGADKLCTNVPALMQAAAKTLL